MPVIPSPISLKSVPRPTTWSVIKYNKIADNIAETKKPLSKEVKEDLKDLNETGIKFDPETDFEWITIK